MRDALRIFRSVIIGCVVLCACANNEQAVGPPGSTISVSSSQPMRNVAEAPNAQQETPATPSSVVPGSLRGFQINVGDRVFFSFDSANLDDTARQTLAKEAVWLKRFADTQVTIQGNCDERGTREYNLALGARRAQAVKEYLTVSGVSPARLATISFGKEEPVCSETSEACWAKNRRAVSVITNAIPPNVATR